MTFTRKKAENWQEDVPGARWLKADLQLHTVDDLSGQSVKIPEEIRISPEAPEFLEAYAKLFLQGAIRQGVQVLGLTPHSPEFPHGFSAVWKIVEEWNNGIDDDGTSFREKIYAVFPGFEPAFPHGNYGLHLLFLFDPEIGYDRYKEAFTLVMGGRKPWKAANLQKSRNSVAAAFKELQNLSSPKQKGATQWDYIVLAPHIRGSKGLLQALKGEMLKEFAHAATPHKAIAGFELSDNELPDDAIRKTPWVEKTMREESMAFFHSSDTYDIKEIGRRHTWFKLATPRIEALRQALIASDSRMRIGFERSGQTTNGELQEIQNPPNVASSTQKWLKSIKIKKGASFFSGPPGNESQDAYFAFSSDFTCVIGGSMTGKSTLLDGLRVYFDAELPKDKSLREQVKERGKDSFLAGSPEVEFCCPGRDKTAPLREQWPAVFYTQSELQYLTRDETAIEAILTRSVPSETEGIKEQEEIKDRDRQLQEHDETLAKKALQLAKLNEKVGEAEQARERASRAQSELAAFSAAGIDKLHQAKKIQDAWRKLQWKGDTLLSEIRKIILDAEDIDSLISVTSRETANCEDIEPASPEWEQQWQNIRGDLNSAKGQLNTWLAEPKRMVKDWEEWENKLRVEVERTLAEQGLDARKLTEFQLLQRQASLLTSHEAHLKESHEKLAATQSQFDLQREERRSCLQEQRAAFDRVIKKIEGHYGQQIRASRANDGNKNLLGEFLSELKERGITRWWKDLKEQSMPTPTPEELIAALENNKLDSWAMSERVQKTLREQLTQAMRWQLAAIRCPDRYSLSLRVDDDSYRPLDELSGGQKVATLLSLLLETADDRPLIIDQPEDELDNSFLFETLLPALKKLKGRRQVILATHNANIVVNGDADVVIQLDANALHGYIKCWGGIENDQVRKAIVDTVDGGKKAFGIRRLKYGF